MADSTPPRTRSFLHQGLVAALSAGNIDIARYFLSASAPIVRQTSSNIHSAPSDKQLPLFELLLHYDWTVNTLGFYGVVLLPRVIENLELLHWFLLHGADPNLGEQRPSRDRTGVSETNSCAALEVAAGQGNLAAVRMLLDAGAQIKHGIPLYFAAGACLPVTNPHARRVTPSKEFDESRIPVMALLVERGEDVNQAEKSRHMIPRYAIVHAVMAGAVERVRLLLEHGADPELKGAYGSAVTYATKMGSEEMRHVIEEMLTAKELGKSELPLQAVPVLFQAPAVGALRAVTPGTALELLRPTGPTSQGVNPAPHEHLHCASHIDIDPTSFANY